MKPIAAFLHMPHDDERGRKEARELRGALDEGGGRIDLPLAREPPIEDRLDHEDAGDAPERVPVECPVDRERDARDRRNEREREAVEEHASEDPADGPPIDGCRRNRPASVRPGRSSRRCAGI